VGGGLLLRSGLMGAGLYWVWQVEDESSFEPGQPSAINSHLTARTHPPPPRPPHHSGAAARSNEAGRGCLFVAHRGAGAYTASLWDASAPLERIAVGDMTNTSGARFMESFESRHSDHSFTAQVVG
jgi:hypothetical protein